VNRASLIGLDRRRLRRWLALFFLALALPSAFLVYQTFDQLEWEAFHRYRALAEEVVSRIDQRALRLVAQEEARSFADYGFLVLGGDPAANFLQRSPLASFPVRSAIPGLIGYFQVDDQGEFSTPLLPRAGVSTREYGVSVEERATRLALEERLLAILNGGGSIAVQDEIGPDDASVEGELTTSPRTILREALREDSSASLVDEANGPQSVGTSRRKRRVASADDANASLAESELAFEAQQADLDTERRVDTDAALEAIEESVRRSAPRLASQAAFDALVQTRSQEKYSQREARSSLGRVEDLELDAPYPAVPNALEKLTAPMPSGPPGSRRREARKEQGALPEPAPSAAVARQADLAPGRAPVRVSTFESELDPFELNLLDSEHFVLFRKVWRDGQRYVQGALIERERFLRDLVETAFRGTTVAAMSDLLVAWRGDVIALFDTGSSERYLTSARELTGALLYRRRFSAPLGDLELIFSVKRLPPGPAAVVVAWTAGALFLVLCCGFWLLYRVGGRQIDLTRQQQDFVSAVSHELRTPLTSIRMYADLLREGWADEDKRRIYYDFIAAEGERLSRLISNVLQLARMTRSELALEPRPESVAALVDEVRPGIASLIERAGFTLELDCDAGVAESSVMVDRDAFSQIAINLVDNALKFSARAQHKAIDVAWQRQRDGRLRFSVRDYGPGVPKDQMRKIFRLFYRSESELTRETVGTGIGLSLVNQLALAMGAKVDVVNRGPGAEFSVTFARGSE
jgi:signal transduction histidine kinase